MQGRGQKHKLAAWYQASRPAFFVATLVPLALGTAMAAKEHPVNWGLFAVVVVSSFLVHLATNLANDLFDHLAGVDAGQSIGGSRVIQQGLLTTRHIATALFILYSLAALGGLWLLLATRTWWLAGYMLLAFCSSLFYTAPPLRLGYHGLGELTVFLNMGPVMVTGAYAVQTGRLTTDALMLSVPTGLMVALILFYQSLPDIETDRATGKRTIAVQMGRERSIRFFRTLGLTGILAMILLHAFGLVSPLALASLFTVPLLRRMEVMLNETDDLQQVHGRGKPIRLFYLINGILLILAVSFPFSF